MNCSKFLAPIATIDGEEVVFDHYTVEPESVTSFDMVYLGRGKFYGGGEQLFYFWKYKRGREGKC